MKRLFFLCFLMVAVLVLNGQTIRVTFICAATGNQVNRVIATNLKTGMGVTVPGNETLVLFQDFPKSNGMPDQQELSQSLKIYPNPFSGMTTFSVFVQKPQRVSVKVLNLAGLMIAQNEASLPAGENEFILSLAAPGIYLVSTTTESGTAGCKVICTDANQPENRIEYSATVSSDGQNSLPAGLKSSQGRYSLNYAPGDIILYNCKSCNNHSAVITDKPTVSKNFEVNFMECTDPAGKSYATVRIGEQVWMAENLAWLPSVNPSSAGYEKIPAYYVYGFEDSRVANAKATANYAHYGALYNWEAARTSCPEGWKLPDDADWLVMEKYLGMSGTDADQTGLRKSGFVGSKLKETGRNHWNLPNTGAVNETGFTALPGGFRQMPVPGIYDNSSTSDINHDPYGSFSKKGHCGTYWTASEAGRSGAYSRMMGCTEGGIDRSADNKSLGFSVRCLKVASNTNQAPTASFTISPTSGTTETRFEFDASGSTDAETSPDDLEVRWDFDGDGNWDTDYDQSKTSSCQYPTPGSYSVILEVKDGGGLTDSETKTVTVIHANEGIFTDNRDGNRYPYKTIGTQAWMIKNLA